MSSINESIKNLLTRESIYQAYLDVEVALAKAQAKQEIIPLWAATKIQEKGKLELLQAGWVMNDEAAAYYEDIIS